MGLCNFDKRKQWATAEQIFETMKTDEHQFRSCQDDDCPEPDFEALWERHCSDKVSERDAGQPWWAQ